MRRDVLIKGTALWRYDEQMKKVMAAFKYNGCSEDAKIFAEEFSRFRGGQIHTWGPEVIVPVPLHWRRRWFRGYNQAECLALELGNVMRIPVRTDILMRTRYTKPQKVLDDKERRQNLQEAFCVPDKIRDVVRSFQRVLLVDDIYTTGATIESCASVLHECGVREIYFACLCIGRDYEIS